MRLQGDVEDREHVRTTSERIMQHIAALVLQSERRTSASRARRQRSRGKDPIFRYGQNVVRLRPNPDEPEQNRPRAYTRRFLPNVQASEGLGANPASSGMLSENL
jgi:hypothetical protein